MKTNLFAFALAIACSTIASAQTIDEIVAKYIKASGGAEKLRTVQSIVTQNAISVQGIELENKTYVVAHKHIRSESVLMGNQMVQAFDGSKAWQIVPVMMGGTNEPAEMSATATKSLLAQMDPFPLLDYNLKKTKLEYLGTGQVKGQTSWHLKMTTKDSSVSELWIDASNGFLRKLKNTQDGMPNEIVLSAEREQDGIFFATHMEINNPAAGSITIETKSILVNTAIDTTIFRFPAKKQ
jgi:hypothetical protein